MPCTLLVGTSTVPTGIDCFPCLTDCLRFTVIQSMYHCEIMYVVLRWFLFLFSCSYAAYLNSHHSGDHIAVEIARGEVLCPLCKSLTNGLIPYIAPAVGAALISTEDLVVSDKVFESVQPSTLLDLFVKSSSMQSMQLQASWQLNNITNKDSCNGISSKMNAFFHACLIQYNMLSMGDSYDRIHPTTAFRSIRAAHAAWAAVSYTLLDSTVKSLRSRESIGMSVQLPTILESERSLIVALLATLRSAPTLFANAKEYEEYIALPIKYILVGYDSSISIETSLSSESFDALEMSLSKSTKSSNSTMSWSDRFSSFVSTAQSIGFSVPSSSVSNSVKLGSTDEFRLIPEASCKKADLEMYLSSCPLETVETVLFPDSNTITSAILLARGKGVADKDLWPILKAPLLAHDLHMISMAVLSTASNLSTFSTWNSIVCLCRLVQILIEPQSIGLASNSAKSKTGNEFYSEDISRKKAKLTANSPSSKNNQLDDVVETIENLRNTVCQQSGVSMQEYVPSGSRLLKLVLQSWIPFLEYSYHLRQGVECVAGNMKASDVTVPTASKDSHDELSLLYEYATLILKALDVPDLVNLVQLTSTKRLFKFWTSHYYIFNKGVRYELVEYFYS